ncbi:hypothetical protein CYMTET_18283 [Cymbomonas tetramitiformis]|uniref:EGF-like domain-containing protein n=1 Tax=Cymbomonas tetramitiformis TaxID=36881 RepID=A0AAE0G8G8_9CHLO|nr:hypothetical protein CYMTET_18283 [Cymbomonas tetramitiformis]
MCLPRLFTGDHDKSLAESHSYGKDFASHIDLIPEVPEENFASVDISVDNPQKSALFTSEKLADTRNFTGQNNAELDSLSFRKKACNGRGKIEGSGGTCWCNRMFSGPQCEKGEEFTYNEQLPPRNLPAGYSGDIIMSKAGLKAGPHEIQIFLPDKDPALRTVGKAKGPLLDLVPEKDPIGSKQFKTCAVVGNSGLLLNAKHGSEIDQADMVIRFNGAPTKGIENHVGSKTTLRLVNSKPYGERGTPFGARLQPYGDGYTIYSRLQPYGDGVPFLRTLAALCPMVTGYMFTHACNPMVNGYTVYARLQPYGARALSTHACNPMVTGYPFYARLQPYGDGVHCLRTLAALW